MGTSLQAQWSSDPTVNTLISPISALRHQIINDVTSDGNGGAIVVWSGLSETYQDYNIFAQKINKSGFKKWDATGVLVCSNQSNSYIANVCRDGTGGAIIAWTDKRNGNDDVFAQTIDANNGNLLWGASGKAICTLSETDRDVIIISDENGGAFIVWDSGRWTRVQKVDANGTTLWDPNGITATVKEIYQYKPKAVLDGVGGVIITWEDKRVQHRDIFAQRLNASGTRIWGDNGVGVSDTLQQHFDIEPNLISDGNEGAIIAWLEMKNNYGHSIRAQRINSAGIASWGSNGKAVFTILTDASHPNATLYMGDITTDCANGAILSWMDDRNRNEDNNIFSQRLDADGNKLWEESGLPISTALEKQSVSRIISDDNGGALICWLDGIYWLNFGKKIYAQKVTPYGNKLWGDNGKLICSAQVGRLPAIIVSDGNKGAILTWEDCRAGDGFPDVYAQQINWRGQLGEKTFDALFDGFNWCNCESYVWPDEKGLFPDWELFEEVYGSDQVRYENGQVKMEAQQYFNSKQKGWRGSCFGFSHSALEFMAGDHFPWDWNGGHTVYSIPHHDEIIFEINKHQFYQNYHRADKKNAVIGVEEVYNASRDHTEQYYNLCFFGAYGGHSVVPRYVTDITSTHKRLYIYDNNYPGNNSLYFDLYIDTDQWIYDEPGWRKWQGGDFAIMFYKYNDVKSRPVLPIAENMSQNTMGLHHITNNRVLIMDDEGRKLGWENDSFYDEIPDCHPMIPFLNVKDSVYIITDYELKRDPYTIHLKNMDALPGDFSINFKENIHGFQNINFEQSDNHLQVYFDPDSNYSSIITEDQHSTFVPYFIMNNTEQAKEVTYVFTNLYLKAQEKLDFSVNDIKGEISLGNHGEEKSYFVSFSYGNQDSGVVQYGISNSVTIYTNETQAVLASFDPVDNSYASFTIYRDYNSDGSVDDSLQFNTAKTNVQVIEPTKLITYVLLSNYPNPFNARTTIHYALPEPGRVTLKIYNILGKEIVSLVDSYQLSGEYRVDWDSKDRFGNVVTSGIYIAVLQTGKTVKTSKMLLMK